MKRNTELLKKWIVALRSGEYKQTTTRLIKTTETGDTYCCLGVLCELAVKENLLKKGVDRYIDYDNDNINLITNLSVFKDKIGISGNEEKFLIDMNDIQKCSFNDIADYIENQILPNTLDNSIS